MKLRGYQIDAFTTHPYGGNPAAVIANAEGLTTDQMQLIAREFNNSETAFILPPNGTDHDVLIRFFTPTTEVPSCGHATIAAHYVRALEGEITEETLIQKTGAGLMPMRISLERGQLLIAMTQSAPVFYPPLSLGLAKRVLHALNADAQTYSGLPIQVVSTGHSKVMIPLVDKAQVDALRPDMPALTGLSAEIGCNGYFAFCINSGGDLVYGRMFAPSIGITEDPVTGNANGPAGAYLVRHGLTPTDETPFRFSGLQGVAMGRAGLINVEVERDENRPISVTISGTAAKVFSTEFDAP